MTIKTKFMLWLGAVFASVAAAQLVVPLTDDPALWGPIVISITVFTFLAVAFSPRRWVLISVPLFTLTIVGLSYFRLHPTDPVAIGVLVVAVPVNLLVAWMRLRGRHRHAGAA